MKQSKQQKSNPSKKSILKQVQKLKKQIQQSTSQIKKTQKMLDIDLFLKQQKKKKLQYTKQLNQQFLTQKKYRQQKLYNKYRKKDQQTNKQDSNTNIIQFKSLNTQPTTTPKTLTKSPPNLSQLDPWIKQGHHYTPDQINTQGLKQKQQQTFKNFYQLINQKPKYDGTLGNKSIVWKNIKELAENCLQIVTLPKTIQQHSLIPVDQSAQCILSAAVLMTPKICQQTFSENDQITLSKLYTPTTNLTITISKTIQVRQFTHKAIPLGSKSSNPNTLWPTLLQKSINKLKICRNLPYLSTTINRMIYTLYGLDSQFIPITNTNIIKQNFYLVLGYLLQQGKIGFINYNGHSQKTYQNRIYLLEQVKQYVEKIGKEEKKVIKFKIANPWRGKLVDNQNVNRFTLLELLQMFNTVVILRNYPPKWLCLRINVAFYSNGPIGPTTNQWTNNPQYLFTITKKTPIRLILRKSTHPPTTLQTQPITKQGIFGFLLFENKQSSNKIQSMKIQSLITKTKSIDINQCQYSTQLTKGNYIIIPYCTQKSQQSYKFLTLDILIQKQSYIQFSKARLCQYNYINKTNTRLNTGQQKIIQTLDYIQKYQKPKIQKYELISKFKSINTQSIIQSLNLNLFKNVINKYFFIPGFISNLIINKQIPVQFKYQTKYKSKSSVENNQELAHQQMAENLEYLLGYDAQSDEINQNMMKDYIEQSVGIIVWANSTPQNICRGLTSILESLNQHPQIIQLDLKGNLLNDSSITYLCYYMEKGNRTELRKLNVQNNKYGKIGNNALQGLKNKFHKLQVLTDS